MLQIVRHSGFCEKAFRKVEAGDILENIILKMKDIHKKFPGVYALKNAQLCVAKGEVHALLGENGAGKSTLIKILGGIYRPEQGSIEIEGREVILHGVREARAFGISIIHQELMLIPEMSIADNIFLSEDTGKYGFINSKQRIKEAQALLDKLEMKLDAKALVSSLSVAHQQIVEILKAIAFQSKIIVMDEPTSSLSDNEVNILFDLIKRLKEEGVAIIYISHRLEELFAITDKITVMRDGQTIDTVETSQINTETLIKMMVGRDLSDYYVRSEFEKGEVVLSVNNLSKKDLFKDISFELRKGEILGFAGLVGAGRSEIMQAIFGVEPYDGGNIEINGKRVDIKSPIQAIRAGVVLVPESRKEQGLVLKNTVGFNMTLAVLKRFIKGVTVNKKVETAIMDEYKNMLMIKTPSYEQMVSNLSGGNQQKVVVSKWLAAKPDVLILDEPTRGIDVGAKSEMYSIINELSLKGMSIIMVSSEMQEVMAMSDRICVVGEGRIKAVLEKKDFSQEKILSHALGGVNS